MSGVALRDSVRISIMTATQAYVRAARYFRDDLGKIIFSTLLIGVTTVAGLAAISVCHSGGLGPPAQAISSVAAPVVSPPGANQRHGADHRAGVFHRCPAVVQELIGLWQGYYKIVIGYNGLLRVRRDLYRKFQELSLSYHKSRPQGDAIYRITYDASSIQAAFNVVQTVFVNIVILACMSAIMLVMNWRLGLVAMAIMPVLYLAIRFYGKILTATALKAAQLDSQVTSLIQQSVSSISLVRRMREADEYGRFSNSVESSNGAWIRMHVHSMIYWLVIGIAFGFGLALIFAVGGYLAYKHPQQFTIGGLWIFMQYTLVNLYDPLNKLSGSGGKWKKSRGDAARLRGARYAAPNSDAPDAIDLEVEPRATGIQPCEFRLRRRPARPAGLEREGAAPARWWRWSEPAVSENRACSVSFRTLRPYRRRHISGRPRPAQDQAA